MAKLALHQGAYEARSPIANAQVCINLYPEQNPPDAPFPVTHYPAPGLSLFTDATGYGSPIRGMYQGSDGQLYVCAGGAIVRYNWGPPLGSTVLGNIVDNGQPVSMSDNKTTLVAVDGSPNGYMAPLGGAAGSLSQIIDPAFYGANRVDFIDTFLIFNQPGTSNFYTTTSNVVTPFDPLYFASKAGWNDRLTSIAALHDNIWLLGAATTEIWFNAGGTAFPFARMPNSILQQGCAAPFSPVVADNALYWLSQDRWGHAMMMRGEGYAARRISNFAVEQIWNAYTTIIDCVGMSYQLAGHEIVGFYFPTADAWWAYDATTQMWHRRTYSGSGAWLPYCTAFWGNVSYVGGPNVMLAGDRSSGRIYEIDRGAYTDNGTPITRQRSWLHLQQDGQRINYTRFALSMTGSQLVLGGAYADEVILDWSDDAGQSYGTGVPQTINQQRNGQYLWRRLGYGRDRVYRVTTTAQGEFALNGAYSDGVPEAT